MSTILPLDNSDTGSVAKTKIDSNFAALDTDKIEATQAVVLTNKAINADDNIVSELETDNFKSGVVSTNTSLGTSDTVIPSQKAVKSYVDGTAIAGAPDASTTTKGIVKMSVAPVSQANPVAVGDNDPRLFQEESYIAGEGISVDSAVAIAVTAEGIVSSTTIDNAASMNATKTPTGTTWYAQSFVVPADVIRLRSFRVHYGTGVSNSLTWRLRSTLTGADIITGTIGDGAGNGDRSFTVSPDIAVTPGDTFQLVIGGASAVFINTTTTSTYGTVSTSANSGVTWTTETGYKWRFFVDFIEKTLVAGRAYKARASVVGSCLNFVGFAKAATLAGDSVAVNTQSAVMLPSLALTAGSTYFLSDTAGVISTGAGTISRIIGKALSATSLRRPRNGIRASLSYSTGYGSETFVSPISGVIHCNGNGVRISINGVQAAGFTSSDSTESWVSTPVIAGDQVSFSLSQSGTFKDSSFIILDY